MPSKSPAPGEREGTPGALAALLLLFWPPDYKTVIENSSPPAAPGRQLNGTDS